MGFYAPAQLVRDAREHGVEVRAADVNASHWDNSLERTDDGVLALRLGFRQVDGFREIWADAIVAARTNPFASIEEVARRAALPDRDRKRTRLNSSHQCATRMPSSALTKTNRT